MDYRKLRQAKAIEQKNMQRLLELNPKLNNGSGIYFLTREDENHFKFAYIGQANFSNGILRRLAQHLVGYNQHIDLSLKKHKLYSEDNPYGWKVNAINYPDSELDEKERYWIKRYADEGYQLRNVSLGGQGEGRDMINQTKAPKGYRDGIAQGRKNLARELKHIVDTHLIVTVRKDTKVSRNALEKFNSLLGSDDIGEETQ